METLFVDGVPNAVAGGRSLSIVQSGLIYVGSWNNGGGVMLGGDVAVGSIRVHGGALAAADVAYNYALGMGAGGYAPSATPLSTGTGSNSPTPSGTGSNSPTPSTTQLASLSTSPTPTVSLPCPSTNGFTHLLTGVSLQNAADSTQYMRHACYYIWSTPNYPAGNPVYTMDATMLMRVALDGGNGVSFQSTNYQNVRAALCVLVVVVVWGLGVDVQEVD